MLLADDDIVSAAWYFCRTQAPTTMPCEVIFDGTQAFKRVAGLSDTRTRNSRTRHLSERTAPEQLVILSWLNIERVVGSYQVRANSAHPEMRALCSSIFHLFTQFYVIKVFVDCPPFHPVLCGQGVRRLPTFSPIAMWVRVRRFFTFSPNAMWSRCSSIVHLFTQCYVVKVFVDCPPFHPLSLPQLSPLAYIPSVHSSVLSVLLHSGPSLVQYSSLFVILCVSYHLPSLPLLVTFYSCPLPPPTPVPLPPHNFSHPFSPLSSVAPSALSS
ncbi:hypothetical protein RRG08_045090 [Elysia crispata]|uniref:Uncharacterized protein n=1 Tax=Elysia crispata TaxID=231223 RepID=A0AAE0YT58_9GAST|nr:hypothetical protein RRG08_045090 [Elysia crispata]